MARVLPSEVQRTSPLTLAGMATRTSLLVTLRCMLSSREQYENLQLESEKPWHFTWQLC